jgi:hypothetical protein
MSYLRGLIIMTENALDGSNGRSFNKRTEKQEYESSKIPILARE